MTILGFQQFWPNPKIVKIVEIEILKILGFQHFGNFGGRESASEILSENKLGKILASGSNTISDDFGILGPKIDFGVNIDVKSYQT